MPKKMNDEYKLNFSEGAQQRFNKLCRNENWSWAGLALALIKRFGVSEIEDFHYILGESIKSLKGEKNDKG